MHKGEESYLLYCGLLGLHFWAASFCDWPGQAKVEHHERRPKYDDDGGENLTDRESLAQGRLLLPSFLILPLVLQENLPSPLGLMDGESEVRVTGRETKRGGWFDFRENPKFSRLFHRGAALVAECFRGAFPFFLQLRFQVV